MTEPNKQQGLPTEDSATPLTITADLLQELYSFFNTITNIADQRVLNERDHLLSYVQRFLRSSGERHLLLQHMLACLGFAGGVSGRNLGNAQELKAIIKALIIALLGTVDELEEQEKAGLQEVYRQLEELRDRL